MASAAISTLGEHLSQREGTVLHVKVKLSHGCLSISRMSNKKHKNIKKKASPKADKRLTTMTEEEETLTRNDESKMGLVGQN